MSEDEDPSPEQLRVDDEEFDERKHASLLRNISAMDDKVMAATQRREAASMSEHHAPTTRDHVKLHELVGALQQKTGRRELKKQINRVASKAKTLAVPLSKPEQEMVHRGLAYEKVTKEVSKWNSVVRENRQAEQLKFPLEQPDLRLLESADDLIKRSTPRTSLEMEVAALLGDSEHTLGTEKVLTPAEERALQAMSLEEANERRAELQKYRALLSYKEAKAHRQKKIKSKKYHRILQKEKLKKEKKSLEEMEKTDPEAFAEKLHKVDVNRMQERMSLKHRGGSKFARKQMIYNKYSDQSREAVQDMLHKSRELTKKVAVDQESSDDDSMDGAQSFDESIQTSSSANPWMSSAVKLSNKSKAASSGKPPPVERLGSSEDEGVTEITNLRQAAKDSIDVNIDSLFDRLEAGDIKSVRQMKRDGNDVLEEDESEEEGQVEVEELTRKGSESSSINMSVNRKRTMEDFEEADFDSGEDDGVVNESQTLQDDVKMDEKDSENCSTKPLKDKADDKALSVDPSQFITLGGRSHKVLLAEEEASGEEDEEQGLSIAQAFAADDVVDEFSAEKRDIEDRDKPKDVNLVLPGWGSWGGDGVQVSKRKKKRFTIKAPPAAPRRDRNLDSIIISETKDNTISKHQVSELPFPFTNPDQFESSIRQPIGKTWNPETAYKKLIQPKKVTRLGTVIAPINKSQVFKKQKESGLEPRKKKAKRSNKA